MNTSATRSTPFNLEVRKDTRFDFSELDEVIHTEGNLYTSHFFNALSLMTPITEGILIRAIREAQPMLKDTVLEQDARAFIGQEAIHTREHRQLNRRLAELGLDAEEAIQEIEQEVKALEASMTLQERLAIVVTGEHVIYSLARALLTCNYHAVSQHDEVKKLFVWHALEEMEHQSVCDDVYRHLYGAGIKHRILYYRIFVRANRLLLRLVLKIMKRILSLSRPPEKGEFRQFLLWLLYKPGIGIVTTRELLAFFSPSFAHWKRSEQDQDLINRSLKDVLALQEQ